MATKVVINPKNEKMPYFDFKYTSLQILIYGTQSNNIHASISPHTFLKYISQFSFHDREGSGSMVECLTGDRRACWFEHYWHHCVVSLSNAH